MTLWLFAPFLTAMAAALSARLLQRRLHPVLGTWLLTGLAAGSAAAVLGAIALMSVTYLASVDWIADRVGWCRTYAAAHHAPPAVLGLTALVLFAFAAGRAARVLRLHRELVHSPASDSVVIVDSCELHAFAVPGRPGHIVVTTAMLEALDEDEQAVLFAHEYAHLAHAHHRFVLVGSVAAATFPLLRPLAKQISFSTERWADELAARSVGDRATTARAIAAAAFASSSPAFALGLADLGVVGRVDALLNDSPASTIAANVVAVAGTGLLFLNVAGGVVQMHHLALLVLHICAR